jgi:hypothetical protein
MEAAEVMNKFFVDKVDDLRKKALLPSTHGVPEETPDVAGEVPHVRQETCQVPQDAAHVPQGADDVPREVDDIMSGHNVPHFHFKFANVRRTSEAIKGLNNTEALGKAGIPTSVLKKGGEILAGPVSHLVNRSLAEGRVPAAFKVGRVHPIHTGKGKPREDTGSYCPVSILPAMSKVLESLVKEDLEGNLKRVNGLPGSQYGFRLKRSCTSALAHAQAGWLSGAAKGQVVGLMAFDLSAAFDTVAVEQLAPTLLVLGITGGELRWFLCYMSGGRQCVVWDGKVSGLINVLYGVRQGLILGPILFIILNSGMAKFLGVKEEENIVYADDSNVWQTGSTKEEVARKLAEKAALFVEYTRRMGLSMNATKTQLLFSSHAGNVSKTTVEVDGNNIHPGDVIELLGVRYDRKPSTSPHLKSLLAAVRQRASVVARLANHLPKGAYLRQLSYGLVMGKFSHALAAVARPRLEYDNNASVIWSKIQVAFNDVARSITGARCATTSASRTCSTRRH